MQRDLTYTVSPKVDGLKKESSALKFYAWTIRRLMRKEQSMNRLIKKETNQYNSPMIFTYEKYIFLKMIWTKSNIEEFQFSKILRL